MVRVMNYNIHHATEDNLKKIANFARSREMDILGVLEAEDWKENDGVVLKQFSNDSSLPYNFFAKANTRHNLALFAKKAPLEISQLTEGLWHTMILAVYTSQSLGDIAFGLLHLSPKDEDTRLAELKKILDFVKPFEHCVLMGDFNSLSPRDPYDRKKLLATFQKMNLTKFGDSVLRFDCVEFLDQHGFVDAAYSLGRAFAPTVPTTSNQDLAHAVPLRLDYTFVSSALVPFLSNVEIIKNEITDSMSDHYPLVADFSFSF